jgi:hypothetical protein
LAPELEQGLVLALDWESVQESVPESVQETVQETVP